MFHKYTQTLDYRVIESSVFYRITLKQYIMPVEIKLSPRKGDVLNPDEQKFNNVFRQIAENNGHCITKVEKRFGHDLCPCQNYLAGGKCFCGLYVKENDYEKK